MRLLMCNYHVPYIYMLARTGHEIFVINPPNRVWDFRMRPLPPNVKVIETAHDVIQFGQAIKNFDWKFFDKIIMQDFFIDTPRGLDLQDNVIFKGVNLPKVVLFHNSFYTQFRGMKEDKEKEFKKSFLEFLKEYKLIFISDFKKKSYAAEGAVIPPGFDINEWGGWRGHVNKGLICLNNASARDFMNGTQKMALACANYDYDLVGEEGGHGNIAQSYDHLKELYRNHRMYICFNNPKFEDGYNLSMLEAMATGMPAVTLDHFSSPIKNGVNGFKSDNLGEINKFLKTLSYSEAYALGRRARETVFNQFKMDDFVDNWNEVLEMK